MDLEEERGRGSGFASPVWLSRADDSDRVDVGGEQQMNEKSQGKARRTGRRTGEQHAAWTGCRIFFPAWRGRSCAPVLLSFYHSPYIVPYVLYYSRRVLILQGLYVNDFTDTKRSTFYTEK
jgi:hypothetical protein